MQLHITVEDDATHMYGKRRGSNPIKSRCMRSRHREGGGDRDEGEVTQKTLKIKFEGM